MPSIKDLSWCQVNYESINYAQVGFLYPKFITGEANQVMIEIITPSVVLLVVTDVTGSSL
jgi:hypothetical protein